MDIASWARWQGVWRLYRGSATPAHGVSGVFAAQRCVPATGSAGASADGWGPSRVISRCALPYLDALSLTLMTTFAQRHCITLASPVLGRRLSPPIPGVPGARSPPLSLPASPPSHHLLMTPPPTEHINVNARHRSIPGSGPSSAPIMGTAVLATCYCCCCGKPDPVLFFAQPVSSPRSRSRKGSSSRAVLRMRPASAVRADGGDSRGRALWTETRIERPCWSAR